MKIAKFIVGNLAKGFVAGIALGIIGECIYCAGRIDGANEAYNRVEAGIHNMYEKGYAVCRVEGDDESLL